RGKSVGVFENAYSLMQTALFGGLRGSIVKVTGKFLQARPYDVFHQPVRQHGELLMAMINLNHLLAKVILVLFDFALMLGELVLDPLVQGLRRVHGTPPARLGSGVEFAFRQRQPYRPISTRARSTQASR